MVWVYKVFWRNKALSRWPYITFRVEADGIVEADNKFKEAFGYPADDTKLHIVLRHASWMCWDSACLCKLPLWYAVSH